MVPLVSEYSSARYSISLMSVYFSIVFYWQFHPSWCLIDYCIMLAISFVFGALLTLLANAYRILFLFWK